ncbi:MAG: MBL fold metallo-hydrolase [bacterium]|nr:MBL fold metallo-hydrolase [bacterium]
MPVKITILVDNSAGQLSALLGEHGFSALVEADGFRLLFDTGAGRAVIPNVQSLGIDLSEINAVVISHGHYDHTGGLPPVLSRMEKVPVYLGAEAWADKFALLPDGSERWIGMPAARDLLEKSGARFELVAGPRELAPGIILTGPIPRTNDFETVEPILQVKKAGELQPDPVSEDQALILKGEEGITVLTGCAHAGVVNTLAYAMQLTGASEIHGLIGGFHLLFSSGVRLDKTVAFFRQAGLKMLAPCHCTGFRALAELHRRAGELMVPVGSGSIFSL